MKWLNDQILEIIFPKKCVGCGKMGEYVCRDCEVGMWEEEQICPVCRRNSRYGLRHKYCNKQATMEGLTGLWAYEGITRRLISQSKYRFYFDYLKEFVIDKELLMDRLELTYFWEFLQTKPVLVPVPLHPNREKKRGFNQSKIIAEIVGRQWGLEIQDLLLRVKDTGQQVGRAREERLKEMEGAFQINEKLPYFAKATQGSQNLSILLVDDVWTTGATMSECAKVLRKAGVRSVWGFVLAR